MFISLAYAASLVVLQDTVVLGVEAAVARALRVSPTVAAALGAVRAPRGIRAETRWPFPDNPTLEYGRVRRRSGVASVYDRQWSLSQNVEIAGQGAVRSASARALIRSVELRVDEARRVVALETRRAYATLAIAERRAALLDSSALFAERLAEFAEKQFVAGEFNRLERNVVVLETARARSAADRARAQVAHAAADLSRLLGLPRDSTQRTTSLPAVPDLRWASDAALVTLARDRRPDLHASAEMQLSAGRAAAAARLALVPNLTISAFNGREAATDELLGVAIGVSIPLFHRQQTNIGAADAGRIASEAALASNERAVQAEVLAAAARFLRARSAERRFAGEVLRVASENVRLTERALAEGEVSLTEVLVLRTTAAGAQLEYLDVLHDAWSAWFELAAALAAEPAELATLLGSGA